MLESRLIKKPSSFSNTTHTEWANENRQTEKLMFITCQNMACYLKANEVRTTKPCHLNTSDQPQRKAIITFGSFVLCRLALHERQATQTFFIITNVVVSDDSENTAFNYKFTWKFLYWIKLCIENGFENDFCFSWFRWRRWRQWWRETIFVFRLSVWRFVFRQDFNGNGLLYFGSPNKPITNPLA